MTFYCNDCGGAFDPRTISDVHPDGVGRCRGCIHESGDCSPYQVPCALCRAAHDQGHRDGEPSPYCQVCRTKAEEAKADRSQCEDCLGAPYPPDAPCHTPTGHDSDCTCTGCIYYHPFKPEATISPRLSRLLFIGQPLLDRYNEEKMR